VENLAAEIFNLGFFALKPDKRLFQASLTLGGRGWQAVRSSSGDMLKLGQIFLMLADRFASV